MQNKKYFLQELTQLWDRLGEKVPKKKRIREKSPATLSQVNELELARIQKQGFPGGAVV